MTEAWWSGLQPIEVRLECLSGMHRVRWEEGVLHALDHEDPDGERALEALGADRAPCIELLDTWARHADDLKVLTVASRGASDPVQIEPEGQVPPGVAVFRSVPSARPVTRQSGIVGRTGWTAFAPLSANHRMMVGPGESGDEVVSLMALNGVMAQRLAATVIATWADRLTRGDEIASRPALTAALYGRVASSVRSWLCNSAIELELTMVGAWDTPSMHRSGDTVTAELPFQWLSDIWVRELSVVLARFALSAPNAGSDHLELLTISPDFTELRPVTISVS